VGNVYKFDRCYKHKGPAPSKENGAVYDGTPTTFVDFLAKVALIVETRR
jgi:hypothetical protein